MEEDIKIIKSDVKNLDRKVDAVRFELTEQINALTEQVDGLAISTKKQLDEVNVELRDHRELFTTIIEKMELMHDDIRDIKNTNSSLVKSQASADRITTDHEGRLIKIEGHLELV